MLIVIQQKSPHHIWSQNIYLFIFFVFPPIFPFILILLHLLTFYITTDIFIFYFTFHLIIFREVHFFIKPPVESLLNYLLH